MRVVYSAEFSKPTTFRNLHSKAYTVGLSSQPTSSSLDLLAFLLTGRVTLVGTICTAQVNRSATGRTTTHSVCIPKVCVTDNMCQLMVSQRGNT